MSWIGTVFGDEEALRADLSAAIRRAEEADRYRTVAVRDQEADRRERDAAQEQVRTIAATALSVDGELHEALARAIAAETALTEARDALIGAQGALMRMATERDDARAQAREAQSAYLAADGALTVAVDRAAAAEARLARFLARPRDPVTKKFVKVRAVA